VRKKEKGLKLPVIPWIVRGSWILKQRPSKYDRLTALVVGGATAVAAKSGLLKGLWKLIVAGRFRKKDPWQKGNRLMGCHGR
jgi:hypothetical protein